MAKGAFDLGENDFRKSFSPFSACLVATENTIFWKLYSCWPFFTPLTRKWIYTLIFTSIHFRVTLHTQQHREKERRETQKSQEHRENESSDPATQTSDPATESSEPKTQLPSARVRERTHCSDLPHAGDAEFSQTITAQTNARSSSASRSPSQTLYHGEFSVTGSPSIHSLHLRPTHVWSTHSPHRSDLCILYIYFYIYLYIYLLFFIY